MTMMIMDNALIIVHLCFWQSVEELYDLAEQCVLRTPEGCKQLLSISTDAWAALLRICYSFSFI